MPDYTVQWILGRALSNPTFRELMARDPEAAWEGYELTEADRAELKKWTPQRIQAFLADLELKIVTASFDGATGFDIDETASAANCDDPYSLEELKKLFGADTD